MLLLLCQGDEEINSVRLEKELQENRTKLQKQLEESTKQDEVSKSNYLHKFLRNNKVPGLYPGVLIFCDFLVFSSFQSSKKIDLFLQLVLF